MDPKHQLQSDNNYSPSPRAAAAVRTAHGGNSGAPDKADSGSVSAPSEAKQPSDQHTGGPVKANDHKSDQSTIQPYDAGHGKPEKGN